MSIDQQRAIFDTKVNKFLQQGEMLKRMKDLAGKSQRLNVSIDEVRGFD